MKKYTLAAAIAVAATNGPAAYALNFDFHFDTSDGVLSGEITGLAASGESSGAIQILSVPTGIPAIPAGAFFPAGLGFGQLADAFVVNNGMIVSSVFDAYHFLPSVSISAAMYLAINYGGHTQFSYQRSSHRVGPLASAIGPVAYTLTVGSSGGSGGGGTSGVPEPASIALLGAGIAGIATFRRRRAAG